MSKITYDSYYETENLFGEPYPELIEFFSKYPKKGKVLDLGCGQGRDAIFLARLGYNVTGIDVSEVGINQMNLIGKKEGLNLTGIVKDIYAYNDFDKYDFILLDSMFHFAKNDRKKEVKLIQNIVAGIANGALVVFCIQYSGDKVKILNQALEDGNQVKQILDKKFIYTYEDSENGHKSETDYRIIVIEK